MASHAHKSESHIHTLKIQEDQRWNPVRLPRYEKPYFRSRWLSKDACMSTTTYMHVSWTIQGSTTDASMETW